MLRCFILLFCSLCFTNAAFSQQTGKYIVRHFNTENGLPSNGIKGLQWDEKTGFLWVATEAGIVRFNGLDFRTYTQKNTPAITSERILFLVRNNAGNIISVDESKNIFTIDQNDLVFLRKADEEITPAHNKFFALEVSNQFYEKIDYRSPVSFLIPFDNILPIDDTSCFILHGNRLFYRSVHTQRKISLPLKDSSVNNAFKIGSDYFIINDQQKIFKIPGQDGKLFPISIAADSSISFSLRKDSWVHWQNGMPEPILFNGNSAWLLSYKNNSITAEVISTELPEGILFRYVQYSKKNNLLFIGTDSKGLIIIHSKRVEQLKQEDAGIYDKNAYYVQLELQDGSVLTGEGHLFGKQNSSSKSQPISGKFGNSIWHSSDNILWYNQYSKVSGNNCLNSYDYNSGRTKTYEKIKVNGFNSIIGSGGNIYITDASGIGKVVNDSLEYLHKFKKSSPGFITFAMEELEPGILVLASCAGLLRVNVNTGSLDTLWKEDNFCVRSLWRYKNYLFFGTYGRGFYMYRKGVIKAMPLDINNYLLYTHCFIPDNLGYCWMSTNRGLFKAKIDDLVNAFEHNVSTVYYHYLGKSDGMGTTEMNGGCYPCAIQLRNKILSFPTMDGLLQVDPVNTALIFPEGDIFIDNVLIEDKTISQEFIQQNILPATTREIAFEIGCPAWCNKENIYLEYHLDNSSNWIKADVANPTRLHINHLTSGDHVLKIRKLNGFGVNNYSYKEVRFTVRAIWYKQWWFYVAMAAVITGCFILFYQIKTRRFKINEMRLQKQVAEKTKELQEKNDVLEKNNTIKTRLISIISHDIITPLKFLMVAGKNLQEKKKLMSEQLQEETIQEMTSTSRELHLLSTNILNWIKYQNENRFLVKENFNLSEMASNVINVWNSMAKRKQLLLVNKIERDIIVYQYPEPLRILLYNLVANSINFSEKGSIIIDANASRKNIVVSVKDEGVGMTPEQIHNIMADQFIISSANIDKKKGNGLGYLIIKDLVKTMNATISIQSEKGKGTEVTVSIPLAE